MKHKRKNRQIVRGSASTAGPKLDERGWREKVVKENALFESYYRAQCIVPDGQWEDFMDALRRELPHCFRMAGCFQEATLMKSIFESNYIDQLKGLKIEDSETDIDPPQVLPWYPLGLAYQMKLPRHVIRKSDVLHAFHNFLVTETELGSVSRQEAVSMIPPLLMDIRADSKILDMCAAPGSKTAQLVEALHSAAGDSPIPSGVVVANDVDQQRCYLLVHQALRRLPSPSTLVICSDASCLPSLYAKQVSGDVDSSSSSTVQPILFDRILADVPCGGDGTLRKNLDLWHRWSPSHAHGIHKLQLRIAKRAVELLAPGGRMVYSTCSLNPVEDEAVVSELLRWAQGSLELIDVSQDLPGLKTVEGLNKWVVMDKSGNFYHSYAEIPVKLQSEICDTVFPPNDDESQRFNLCRCFRVLPHHQDTGGFFVAVLSKREHLPWFKARLTKKEKQNASNEATKNISQTHDCNSTTNLDPPPSKKAKRARFQGYRESPFIFLDAVEDQRWQKCKAFFQLGTDFPEHQLLGRSEHNSRTLYLVNSTLKSIIEMVEKRRTHVKVINAGVRIFARLENDGVRFRIAQEGLPILMRFMGAQNEQSRLIDCQLDDIKLLLLPSKKPYLPWADFSEQLQAALVALREGSVALRTQLTCIDGKQHCIAICAWRGKANLAAYIAKEIRMHLLRLMGENIAELEEQMRAGRRKGKAKRKQQQEKVEEDDDDVGNNFVVENDALFSEDANDQIAVV